MPWILRFRAFLQSTNFCGNVFDIDNTLHPFDWYKFHVLHGAKEHLLPDQYIQQIQEIKTSHSIDAGNRIKELVIYSKEELSICFRVFKSSNPT